MKAAGYFGNNVGVREHVLLAGIGGGFRPKLQCTSIRDVDLGKISARSRGGLHTDTGGCNGVVTSLRIGNSDVAHTRFVQECGAENEGVNKREIRVLRDRSEDKPGYVTGGGIDGLS